jgi:hypothetical protein
MSYPAAIELSLITGWHLKQLLVAVKADLKN